MLALLGFAGLPEATQAQETGSVVQEGRASRQDAEPRGRLGIYLAARCLEIRSRKSQPCRRLPLVESVILGGPAERAGVQPGDTLVAVGGKSVTSAAGRELLFSLTAGRPVQVQLGRAGGRVLVHIIPAVRPMDLRPLRVRMMPPGQGGVSSQVFRVPMLVDAFAWPGPVADFRVSDDSLGTIHVLLPNRRMTIRGENGKYAFEFDFSGGESARFGPPGGEHRYSQYARVPAAEARHVGPGRTRAPARYVWLDAELGPRLKGIRDSVLKISRSRLDSLTFTRLKIALARLSNVPELRPYLVSDRRVAGAEFEPVSPGLAEALDVKNSGLLVLRVLPKTPAALLGLRAGDVVVEAGGESLSTVPTLQAAVEAASKTGVVVRWIRKGAMKQGVLRIP